MAIAWHYLDKKAAAVEALKDYGSMGHILEHTDEKIYSLRCRMETPRTTPLDGMPKADDPKAGEDRLITCIDEINMLRERYRQAVEYMHWFRPAWKALTDEERLLLEEFFLSPHTKTEAVLNLGEKLYLERSQIYYRRDKAVSRLALLLYGK